MVEARERKSVFLREAFRETGLAGEVLTARFEDFAASQARVRRHLRLVTVRAVRLDGPLAGGGRVPSDPGGRLFWFHEQGRSTRASWTASVGCVTTPLVPALKSYLSIATKA